MLIHCLYDLENPCHSASKRANAFAIGLQARVGVRARRPLENGVGGMVAINSGNDIGGNCSAADRCALSAGRFRLFDC